MNRGDVVKRRGASIRGLAAVRATGEMDASGLMVVYQFPSDGRVRCVWFSGSKVQDDVFPVDAVEVVVANPESAS